MMVAKCDTDTSISFWDVVRPIVSPEFLSELAFEFQFDVEETRAEWWITKACALYVRGRRAEEAPKARDRRRILEALIVDGKKFADRLAELDQTSFSLRFTDRSTQNGDKIPFDRPDLEHLDRLIFATEYVAEAERLVRFIVEQVEHQVSALEVDRGGRPRNQGFDGFMAYVADFWETEVGRRFTIDYHAGEGTTPAFDFAKRVVRKLDDVSNRQIVTAMRVQIKERADHINRPSQR